MKFVIITYLAFISFTLVYSQNLLIDGQFSDWQSIAPIHTDNTGDQGISQVDFGEIRVHNDADFLFLHFEVGEEINLQDNNEIELWIDTDNNPSSGVSVNGLGADLFYAFGNRSGFVYLSGSQAVFHHDIGLVSAPTVTSDQFELAIRKDISFSGQDLFSGSSIRLFIKDNTLNGDFLPDVQGGIEYIFLNNSPVELPVYTLSKADQTHLRMLSYNVLFNGLLELPRSVPIARLIQAIQPDIINFQEIYDYSSAQVRAQVETILPSSAGENWYHAKAGPDVHTISRFPILNTFTIDGNGAFLLDLTEQYGTELLLIGAHLPCCGNNSERQLEIDAIMAFIRDAKDGTGSLELSGGTPIVIMGDLNLVGDAGQLESLLTGDISNEWIYGNDFAPDWDEAPFEDAHPYTTGLPMSFTWYDENSSFSPGRLDYIIYSGSNMELTNSFALFSNYLPADSLAAFSLMQNDAVMGSDHLPLVADFQLSGSTSIEDPASRTEDRLTLHLNPNPASGQLTISFYLPQAETTHIIVSDINGKIVRSFSTDYPVKGDHTLSLDTSELQSGFYLIRLTSGQRTIAKKIILTQ